MLDAVERLAVEWRQEAATFRRRGAVTLADAAESFAADLETRLREWKLEALTLEDAVKESGYSYSALQKKVASGEIENVGGKGSPRIRREELPRKGGRATTEPDLAGAILARA
jgi:hypothetical protein